MNEFSATLHSEFGHVRVSEDWAANGPRMKIESLRSGNVVFLDPLELESLTQWRHDDLKMIVLTPPYRDDYEDL